MKHRSPHRHAVRSFAARAARAARVQTAPRRLVRALAACSLLSVWPGAPDLRAQVLPTGMNPVAGQVTARTVGPTLTVTNSPNAMPTFSASERSSTSFWDVGFASTKKPKATRTGWRKR